MIPGGKIQDKYGPTASATIGAIAMGIGMIIAGTAKSYAGILWGFGVGGGIAMGVAYAAPVPATGKWLGPHQRGFFLGLTVAGYGGAAFYVSPLIKWMIVNQSLSSSFTVLGVAYLIAQGLADAAPAELLRDRPFFDASGGGVVADIGDLIVGDGDREQVRREVLETALNHHLVSRYTSLVAVDITPSRRGYENLNARMAATGMPKGWQ